MDKELNKPAPGKWWPLDKKVWSAGLITGVVSTALSYLHFYTGIDLNAFNWIIAAVWPLIPGLSAVAQPDVTTLLSLIIAMAIAQYLAPAMQDKIAWLDNLTVKLATAAPKSPVNAVIVPPDAAQRVVVQDIKAGIIPPEIIAERNAVGLPTREHQL